MSRPPEQPRFLIPPENLCYNLVTLRFVQVFPGDTSRGFVPKYHFRILIPDSSDVGHINFRVGDTPHVLISAGHIGFAVAEPFRGHGYALQACRAIVPFVKSVYQTVIVICAPDNHASRRTIEKLGASLIDEIAVPPDDPHYQNGTHYMLRYRWNL